jgi:RNA polymerase sigma factor for flagellar operon FliA
MQPELIERYVRVMWQHYARGREPGLGICLVEFYIASGLIDKHARELSKSLPRHVDIEDLVSAGAIALLGIMKRFDPGRGVRFETFSHRPIHGAMIDHLRKIDPLSRGKRHQINQFLKTSQTLQMELGRPPSAMELQHRLKVSPARLTRMEHLARQSQCVAIDSRPKREPQDSRCCAERLCAPVPQWSQIARNDVRRWITRNLPHRDRLIIVLYYYENLSMKEIGQVLDLSEARVSQLHKQIIQQLRERLHNRSDELLPNRPTRK